MVKFKSLAQFPVDHLAHPVISGLILFLREFTAFAYYVIDPIYPTPPLGQDMTQGQFLSGV